MMPATLMVSLFGLRGCRVSSGANCDNFPVQSIVKLERLITNWSCTGAFGSVTKLNTVPRPDVARPEPTSREVNTAVVLYSDGTSKRKWATLDEKLVLATGPGTPGIVATVWNSPGLLLKPSWSICHVDDEICKFWS